MKNVALMAMMIFGAYLTFYGFVVYQSNECEPPLNQSLSEYSYRKGSVQLLQARLSAQTKQLNEGGK